jgi:NADH-quinone oxidoreductase subunit G
VVSVGAVATKGLAKASGRLVPARPGEEAGALRALDDETRALLAQPGAVIMVGERIAGSAGAASAAVALARETGAALAWVPRRAGERGALDAGALAGLLPGGRPLADPAARAEVAAAWGIDAADLPAAAGLCGPDLLDAASRGELAALVVGGVSLEDYPDPLLVAQALEATGFVVSLENHHSAVTALADVVLPVAVVSEKAGTFVNWEGRPRPFGQVFRDALTMADARVLAMVADAMGLEAPADVPTIRRELGRLGPWTGARTDAPDVAPAGPVDGTVLATWRQLLDSGVMQDGEPHLAATARPTVALVSAATAAGLGETVTVTGPTGSVTLPVAVGEVLDGVVWLPLNSPGCHVHADLGAVPGSAVQLTPGGAA